MILHEFEERLSEFLECLCLTASAGYSRAARLYAFFEVLSPFFATRSLFLASCHQEGDTVRVQVSRARREVQGRAS